MEPFEHPDLTHMALTDILAALGDPIRMGVIATLARSEGEVAWGDFHFEVNKATLSYHMKTLRMAGLIQHRKEGTRCFVSLRKELNQVFPGLLQAILKAAEPKL